MTFEEMTVYQRVRHVFSQMPQTKEMNELKIAILGIDPGGFTEEDLLATVATLDAMDEEAGI